VSRCVLAVEEDMLEAITTLQKAKLEGEFRNIQIVPVPAIYPTGGERQLI
jgi:electron transport complex protein RnfC